MTKRDRLLKRKNKKDKCLERQNKIDKRRERISEKENKKETLEEQRKIFENILNEYNTNNKKNEDKHYLKLQV